MHLHVNGALREDLALEEVTASYLRPFSATILEPARHDASASLTLGDRVAVREPGTGTFRFRGRIAELVSGGVGEEGRRWLAYGPRWRLETEPVRINGRGFYVWNRRGHTCSEGEGGEDSPGADGGKWTAGEIILDILEHAFGVPAGGSDISGHHGNAGCCTDMYLSGADDIAGYFPAEALVLNSVVGEFSVDNTSVADAISLLLGLNGGFYGWFVDPDTAMLRIFDLDGLVTMTLEAGELGHWQDEGGTDYVLLDNQMRWSLDGVVSTIIVQGTDETTEERPENIEGEGNAGSGDEGELELVAAPWRGFDAAYRPAYQPKRRLTGKAIDEADDFTPPAGYSKFGHRPRVYVGTEAGAKTLYDPSSDVFPRFLLPSGMIAFHEVPSLEEGEKLWAWYWAHVPFTVQAGPDGDAYHWYGYERTRTVYDPAFRHTSSWPKEGTADDEAAMTTLADRLLRLYRDVRREGVFRCDGLDFAAHRLIYRYAIENLGPWALEGNPAWTTTQLGGYDDPIRWDTLDLNAVEITYDFRSNATEIHVANTFFMLPEYSELKRRLEMNLFAQRELDLSEDQYDCQSYSPVSHDTGEDNVDDDGNPDADAVGTTAETEAAQTDTWSRDDTAVRVTKLSRIAYDDAGDETLYAYYRDFAYDAEGKLTSVSAETRVTIDVPEACT